MIKTTQTIVATDWVIATTAGEALSARDAVYISTSDGKAYKCDATDLTKMDFVGFAQEAASLNAAVNIVCNTMATGFSSLAIGAQYYLSGTAGAITATAPTNVRRIGVAVTATVIKIDSPTKRTVVFTSGGTWTKRAGLKYAEIEVVGAGGGGGSSSSTNGRGGPGGGGGGYSRKLIRPGSLGSTETVTVGTGGAGGSSGAGSAGGNSSFGTHATANGGSGGPGSAANAGGAGGTASNGDVNVAGQGGQAGNSASSSSGAGGSSSLGGGAKGVTGDSSGVAGGAYGGGGSGGSGSSGSTDRAGGSGADGIVIVHEFY